MNNEKTRTEKRHGQRIRPNNITKATAARAVRDKLGIASDMPHTDDRLQALAEFALQRIGSLDGSATYADLVGHFERNGASRNDLEIALELLKPAVSYDCKESILTANLTPLGFAILDWLAEVRHDDTSL